MALALVAALAEGRQAAAPHGQHFGTLWTGVSDEAEDDREVIDVLAGLWLAYLVLRTVFGVGSTHALMLVLIGLLAWFVLYLVWALPGPEEPRWRTDLRIAAVLAVTLGLWVLSMRASDTVDWIALGGFFLVVGIGTAWASRPIRHTG